MADGDRPADDTPSFPLIRKLDAAWFRGEQLLCSVMFLAMSLLVFLAVVRDIFGTRREWIDVVLLLGFTYGAIRTRKLDEGKQRPGHLRSLGIAVAMTAAVAGAVYVYVEAMPGGFIWAPKMALCLMLWVALLGASMATYEKVHLSLEFGEKLWPAKLLHVVRAFAHAVTSACCVVLLLVSIDSVREHFADWEATQGFGANVPSMDWLPRWAVFLILPYVFGAMALRLFAQSYTTLTKTAVEPKEQLPT